jgi:polysaccharide export outer membrane protein
MSARGLVGAVCLGVMLSAAPAAFAQTAAAPAVPAASAGQKDVGITPPADYVIGPGDKLSVLYWDDAKMSADVVVRPDGMISLPLLNDVRAAGLTPDQLRATVTKGATAFVEGPNVQVIVREIVSRRVFITGMVASPAHYPLVGPTNVIQLIAMAGGLQEYANKKNIRIIREENGQQRSYRFNYNDVLEGKNLAQNIDLKPGDTVLVP